MESDYLITPAQDEQQFCESTEKGESVARYDLRGRSILDICGGPLSILLRCTGFGRAVVVDPLDFPDSVRQRYDAHGIEQWRFMAEQMPTDQQFDEAIIYNGLAHVQDPNAIIERAKRVARTVRVVEALHTGLDDLHPFSFDEDFFVHHFQNLGKVRSFPSDHVPAGQFYHATWTR